MQQFHLNIKYKKGSTNRVIDCLSQPPIATLTMVLDSWGHKTYRWYQLYANDRDFATIYQAVREGTPVENFHIQDGLLCHLGQFYVNSREREKLI